MSDVDPIVGSWYRNQETGSDFEVVAFDEEAQTLEIQYFDGEVEALDLDTWFDLPIDSIEAPGDWTGPFDELDPDDLSFEDDEEFSNEDDLLTDREDE